MTELALRDRLVDALMAQHDQSIGESRAIADTVLEVLAQIQAEEASAAPIKTPQAPLIDETGQKSPSEPLLKADRGNYDKTVPARKVTKAT